MGDKVRARRWYFSTPDAIFNFPDLSIYEQMIYIVLQSHANSDSSAFPSYAKLASRGRMSRRKAIEMVASLVEKGLITKEIRYSSKKENTSNEYIIEDAYDVESGSAQHALGSAQHAPPLVHTVHYPSAQCAPELNHLTLPSLNMFDCMSAAEQIAAAQLESSVPVDKSHVEIYEALQQHAPVYCYVANNLPFGPELIGQTCLMLIKQFPNQLSPEVVQNACELYFEQACQPNGSDVLLRKPLTNPVGFFKSRYTDALKLYKLKQNGRRK